MCSESYSIYNCVVPCAVLPTSASGNGSLAFVVISENDDARGVLQLSSSTYEAEESSQDFVTVSRAAGNFGTVRNAALTPYTTIDPTRHTPKHTFEIV